MRERLGAAHEQAVAGAFEDWRETPEGCVALVILLDQVPRNLLRGSPRATCDSRKITATALDMWITR